MSLYHQPFSASGLLDDIFRFGSVVSRVASHGDQSDYLNDVEEIDDLSEQREEIMQRVSAAVSQVTIVHVCVRVYKSTLLFRSKEQHRFIHTMHAPTLSASCANRF